MLTGKDSEVLCSHEKKLQLSTIGLQTDCSATAPSPMVRPPDYHVYALWLWAMGGRAV